MSNRCKNELVVKSNNQELIAKEYAKLDELIRDYMKQALSPSTVKFYGIDLRIFSGWCESMALDALPATPDTVARFLAQQASSGIKPATLTRRLAAIRMAHEANGFANPTQHKGVKTVFKGIKRDKGTAQEKKAPLTAQRMAAIIAHCPDTLTGTRDKALLLLGFAGAFRRSELVALEVNDIERTPEGIKVTIRKSKTDQEGQGQVIAIPNGVNFRVVDALMAWLNTAGITEGALFRSIKKGGAIQAKALTTRSVANIVKQYAGLAGLTIDDFSGHSLRAGFITSGAEAGADLFKLMEVSRHTHPKTVMGYVRNAQLFDNHAGEAFL
ncbi:site-specific integrase [Legionella wadsworthii]|nr:site-specific integrase [Legionella wadsworthii]